MLLQSDGYGLLSIEGDVAHAAVVGAVSERVCCLGFTV